MGNGEYWIAGGYDGREYLSSIEIRRKDGSWEKSSVELPLKVTSSCMVAIDQYRFLLIGGLTASSLATNSTYLYDSRTNTWERKKDMASVRYLHSCAFIEKGLIMVSGGNIGGSSLSSSEIYDIRNDTWKAGPDLPEKTQAAKMISVDGVTYHIGGHFKAKEDIFRLDKVKDSTWKFSKVGSLNEKHYRDVVAIKISPESCNGWQ